jgi:hypothetical protein
MDQGSTGSLSIVGLEALEKGTNTLKAKQVLVSSELGCCIFLNIQITIVSLLPNNQQ